MSFSFTTVEMRFSDPDGSPSSGTVTFTPDHDLSNGEVTIVARSFTVTLDATGYASAQLVSTEDPDTLPQDSLYRVDEVIDGQYPRSWFGPIPQGPATVNLNDLRPSEVGWG